MPWNETKLASKEFDEALDEAESLVDVEQRRAAMEKVEKVLQDAAVLVQPLWQPKFFVASNKVGGMKAHPTQYHQFHRVGSPPDAHEDEPARCRAGPEPPTEVESRCCCS